MFVINWVPLSVSGLLLFLVTGSGAIASPPSTPESRRYAEIPFIDVPPPVDVPATPAPSREATAAIRYLVYVNSRSSERLAEIQRLDSSAAFGMFRGDQIIQAGLFQDREAAERRSRQLGERGIQGQIAAVTVPDQAGSGTSSTASAAYYVIIPGSQQTLDRALATVQSTVNPGTPIQRRDRPRGLHLAVGPFRERQTAERLSDRLRRQGLSQSRVHYDP
ncbi:hypothetical protein NEA10_12530 [Phormidium yuhuli AB48]|uniref:SPOR domain-containing protein n=1 Tax=Phormidium yuhuli AB48 TaxID=2940671 RepID=A0ABY5AKI0_9CYAN|nr:hypothetical protein [Phormidium yuhuli]USR89704.1 hypothetical protein NEA10_12530 [Phormidium yuhuli AB48]